MDIPDIIYEILIKVDLRRLELSEQRRNILQWRLVSTRFYYTCCKLLAVMESPTQFIVFLNNQELLGDYVDGDALINSELNIVTKKGAQKRIVWIVFACTEGGYIIVKIRTENRPEWSYEIRAVQGGTVKDNKISSLIQKYSNGKKLACITCVEPPSKGFEIEFVLSGSHCTIKVIGKVHQEKYTKLDGKADDAEVIEKRLI